MQRNFFLSPIPKHETDNLVKFSYSYERLTFQKNNLIFLLMILKIKFLVRNRTSIIILGLSKSFKYNKYILKKVLCKFIKPS